MRWRLGRRQSAADPNAPQPVAAGGNNLALVAFAVPKAGLDKLIPAFDATAAGDQGYARILT